MLYDLPLNAPEKREIVKQKDVSNPGSLKCFPNDSDSIVWMGSNNEKSIKATKMLIKLFDSPKYQTLMRNRNVVKLKVWEKIAGELEENGYKIASTPREAGLRAFQKWRNMERTYWKILKLNPDECGEDKRRKKPYFFDDLHAVLSKREKELLQDINSLCNNDDKPEEDGLEDEEGNNGFRPGDLRRKRVSDLNGTDCEAFPRQALNSLTSLVTSEKYDGLLKDNTLYQNKTKVWESIYMDMMKEGWEFGTSIREGALILSEKWRMVEKTILRKKLCGPRTLYTPTFRKALLMEIEERKALGNELPSDPPNIRDSLNPGNRKGKNGEITPETIEMLLKLIGSEYYDNLIKSGGKRFKIWEQMFDEIKSRGFDIAGVTKREKVSRLFQKWRNMKRAFVKYQIAKFKGRKAKKPFFYELMFNIISKDVLHMSNSECDSEEEEEEWDEDSDTGYPTDLLEFSQTDHDYEQPNGSTDPGKGAVVDLPSNMAIEHTSSVLSHPPAQSKPSTSQPSRSYEVLKQIKSLHETSLAMQQQNFSKIISLLENQISAQNQLNTLVSEYIMSQLNKSKSKNGKRTESFSHNQTNNLKRKNDVVDENFLR